jgi:hypothetical protein
MRAGAWLGWDRNPRESGAWDACGRCLIRARLPARNRVYWARASFRKAVR